MVTDAASACAGKWWLGPPPPRAVTRLTRVLQLAVLAVMCTWIFSYLGGLRLSPRYIGDGANDTGQLFNWHPLLLTLAFPLLMGEAVLAYKAPLARLADRPHAKLYHLVLHTLALVCIGLGVAAAFASHNAKRPAPIPNLYSAHSWLGLLVLALLALQFVSAAYSYLWPKLPMADRRALGPLHRFLGQAVFVGGIATMAVGIQEKAVFVQAFAQPPSLRAPVMALPVALVLLLLLTACSVLFHHAPPPVPSHRAHRQQPLDFEAGAQPDEEVLLTASPRFSGESGGGGAGAAALPAEQRHSP